MQGIALEGLDARSGDALLLRWESRDGPRLVLVDGGFSKTYTDRIRARLNELRAKRMLLDEEPLTLDLVVVSHVDSDHIRGVERMFRDLQQRRTSGQVEPYAVERLWFNSFSDTIEAATGGAFVSTVSGLSMVTESSISEGRKLRSLAAQLGVPTNEPSGDLILTPHAFEIGGATFTVVGPTPERLDELRAEWRAVSSSPVDSRDASIAAFVDKSIPNLSSIALHVAIDTGTGDPVTMLLTGDARGDDTLEGLGGAGLLDDSGKCSVDILKVPHHGSQNTVTREYFDAITANHYLISADGTHDNPDVEALGWLVDSQDDREYCIHLTYPSHAEAFLESKRAAEGLQYEISVRDADAVAEVIEL